MLVALNSAMNGDLGVNGELDQKELLWQELDGCHHTLAGVCVKVGA